MQLFNADAIMFFKKFQIFFWPSKAEKTALKSSSEISQIHFFFLTALTAQTAETEEFMFQNVAYWPTVYRTGLWWVGQRCFCRLSFYLEKEFNIRAAAIQHAWCN